VRLRFENQSAREVLFSLWKQEEQQNGAAAACMFAAYLHYFDLNESEFLSDSFNVLDDHVLC